MCEHDIPLGGCYHSGVAWGIGYYVGGQCIELHDKIFTSFDSGMNGGVTAELRKLRENFDPSRDVPKFAVALKPVRIVEPDDDGENTGNAGCDQCGCCDRVDGETWCEDCLDTYCLECEQPWEDCTCGDDDACIHCGLDPDTCGCWDKSDDEDDGDEDTNCICCSGINEDGSKYFSDCNKKNNEVEFPPLNAFARARLLKSQEKL